MASHTRGLSSGAGASLSSQASSGRHACSHLPLVSGRVPQARESTLLREVPASIKGAGRAVGKRRERGNKASRVRCCLLSLVAGEQSRCWGFLSQGLSPQQLVGWRSRESHNCHFSAALLTLCAQIPSPNGGSISTDSAEWLWVPWAQTRKPLTAQGAQIPRTALWVCLGGCFWMR